MILVLLGILGVVVVVSILCAFAWYKIVDPSEAHLVVSSNGKFVVSSDEKVGDRRAYFAIPSVIPFFGRAIRIMDVTIKESVMDQETYEKGQARYGVRSSIKYRIKDVKTAAETFTNDEQLQSQLSEVVKSSVRAVTAQYNVVETRSKKKEIETQIRSEMDDDLKQWGLDLVSFQLVDFQDTEDSKIISNISMRREKEIESKTREENAEKEKSARMKEAEADEKATNREIEKDQKIGEQRQLAAQKISESQKKAKEKEFEVKQVEIIKQAEIDKEEANIQAEQAKDIAIIKANELKETEAINREQKQLEGEGDRLRAEEQAKADAAPIRERGEAEAEVIKLKGFAEAETKEKLQKALNQFGDAAIRALVAEKVVDKDKAIGIALAQALEKADLKVFSGGEGDKQGFNLGSLLSAVDAADKGSGDALLNKLARPNDLGLVALKKLEEDKKDVKPKKDL